MPVGTSIRRTSQKIASDKSNSKNIGGKERPNTTITGNRLMLTLIYKESAGDTVFSQCHRREGRGKPGESGIAVI
ncbi:hypothetical protein CKO_04649 [Citrobacter koseri ATCC BAA-895]|uniref:Uncharacterized protein n=1 Tax=Citrobacter koseri (strain ATCC BAA-895 / CDC 4225-83 / SGSC4696) TaxID=290338 RepID=A8AQD7_CITK8|nr:hypothetical protein CKO_04649 [Citrobacter koseri ATCC BAA-895]